MVVFEPRNNIFNKRCNRFKFYDEALLFVELEEYNSLEAFIIGNSPTINKLNEKQWDRISDGFSVGFSSFSTFDEFKSDVLITECSNYYNSELGEKTLDAIANKYDTHFNHVIIKDNHFTDNKVCDKMIKLANKMKHNKPFLIDTHRIAPNDKLAIENDYYNVFNDSKFNGIITKRASIAFALFMLLKAGFKKINFIACELENSNYFYGVKDDTIHLTNDKRYGLPIEDVIFSMIKAYNDVNKDDKAIVKAHRGRLLSDSIISKFNF